MSRIFSFSDLVEGCIPKPEDFAAARKIIQTLGDHPTVLGGLVYGSVATGTASFSSDFDVLLMIASDHEAEDEVVSEIRRAVKTVNDNHFVPTQAVIIDERGAVRPPHGIRVSLYEHMRTSGIPFGKMNPMTRLVIPAGDLKTEAREYAAQKLERARRVAIDWDQLTPVERRHWLGKVLDCPLQLARKIVHASTGKAPGGKKEVQNLFRTFIERHPEWEEGHLAESNLTFLEAQRLDYQVTVFPESTDGERITDVFSNEQAYDVYLDTVWERAEPIARRFYALAREAPL